MIIGYASNVNLDHDVIRYPGHHSLIALPENVTELAKGKGSLDDQKYQEFGHVSTKTGVACPGNRHQIYQETKTVLLVFPR